jgi:ubiquinone/menaquinone biosynthesis C-methylase UbiE
MRKRRIAVDRYQSGGRLLDVGCATGNYLCEMQRTGRWQVEGIEPNPQAAAYARQRFGVTVHVGQLTHLNLPSANYDAITMWNVLEHVHYPTANLREAYRLLRAGGFLYFAVPVVTGRLRQWFGPYWAEWDLPRHTYIFSQKAVEKFTQAVGFQLIAAIANFSDFRVFHMSLVNWAHEHIAGARWRSFLESVPRFLPVRVILVLTLRVVAPAHANSVLTFVCQK